MRESYSLPLLAGRQGNPDNFTSMTAAEKYLQWLSRKETKLRSETRKVPLRLKPINRKMTTTP